MNLEILECVFNRKIIKKQKLVVFSQYLFMNKNINIEY